MYYTDSIIRAELVEKDILKVDFVEKEIISAKFTTVDLVPDRRHLSTLIDVNIEDLEDYQVLIYDEDTEKWINTTLSNLLKLYQIINESPTKLSVTNFRTTNNYENSSLEVKLNGITEKYVTKVSQNEFAFPYNTKTDDIITCNYIKKA